MTFSFLISAPMLNEVALVLLFAMIAGVVGFGILIVGTLFNLVP